MSSDEWSIARATGIPHLIAISGLHIALFASFGVGLMRLLWKCIPKLTLRWPAPLMEAVASLAFASAYALIAGFGLPTRRALVMIAAMLVANLARRAHAPTHGLALAVVVLLIADPLCVLSAGFWLSFVGVGWLMLCLQGPRRHHWRDMIRSQGVATIGLLPLGIWFFGQSSLIAPLANLIAVPVICFFVLPLGTLGALIGTFCPAVGFPILQATGFVLDHLWSLLETMSHMPGALWYFAEPTLPAFALAIAGSFWMLQPRGIPARAAAILLFLPLLIPERMPLGDGAFELYVLDVGQGLAMIVRTADHVLVYDTGPRYPSGFDLGEAAVVPAMHALGIDPSRSSRHQPRRQRSRRWRAPLSHKHSQPLVIESGEPERLKIPASQCVAGEHWTWNGVSSASSARSLRSMRTGTIVAACSTSAAATPNCCYLAISPQRSKAMSLLRSRPLHRTSSCRRRITAAKHHRAKRFSTHCILNCRIFSTGYLNRFHHPNPDIVARYDAKQLVTLDTAFAGFVHIEFDGASARLVERGRIDRHPYWRE